MQFLASEPQGDSTTIKFFVQTVPPSGNQWDGPEEVETCDKMSLDYMQIQICECWGPWLHQSAMGYSLAKHKQTSI